MATNYARDMDSLLRERKVMGPKEKAALMKQFEAAALKAGQESWNRVPGLEHKKPQSRQKDKALRVFYWSGEEGNDHGTA